MAAMRPRYVCVLCQARQATIARRRLHATTRGRLESLPLKPTDTGFPFSSSGPFPQNAHEQLPGLGQTFPPSAVQEQADELQKMLQDLGELRRTRDSRQAVLRKLSNPWPPWYGAKERNPEVVTPNLLLEFYDPSGGPIAHSVFRERVRMALVPYCNVKLLRAVLRAQLLRCEFPKDILRVAAVAMQNPSAARHLAALAEPITRALYRCRGNASDPEVLQALNVLLSRFRIANLPVHSTLISLGLKFAARARSLDGMKRYLRLLRESGRRMNPHIFRSIIAKFSIGYRGLGEIRNGRWRKDHLSQVLYGFDDATHLPRDQQYHMEAFLDRSDWHFLHAWLAVIARCRDTDGIWREWKAWKASDDRQQPQKLERMDGQLNDRMRGGYWFVQQMSLTGDYKRMWALLEETGIPFRTLLSRVKMRLLDGVEHASHWNDDIRDAMLEKYDVSLAQIEDALGVRWVRGAEDGEGHHELVGDQEEALDRLGSKDWIPPDQYGYPVENEETPIASPADMALHEGEEAGLAELPPRPVNIDGQSSSSQSARPFNS